jgi:hypothetical protein
MLGRTLLLVLLLATPALASASALTERLTPRDEASQDASFEAFRNKLKVIVANKDVAGLKKCLAADITNNFGGGRGLADFNKVWRLQDRASPLWSALSTVLKLGGNFDGKTKFSAPYVYSAWPGDADAFNFVAVVESNAVLRKAPQAEAAPVRKLDYDLLEVINSRSMPQHEAGPNDWDEVKDAKGQRGFILVRDVRSPIDYRAIFEKRNGNWVLAAFVSGD